MEKSTNKFLLRAKKFIDGVISKSNMDYNKLMFQLHIKAEDWKKEYRILSRKNIFELSTEEYDRKNYLSKLIHYSNELLYNFKNKYE